MFVFKRGISGDFVKRLNAEDKLGGWWRAMASDPSLFMRRPEYITLESLDNCFTTREAARIAPRPRWGFDLQCNHPFRRR